jgi:hypothetical protein
MQNWRKGFEDDGRRNWRQELRMEACRIGEWGMTVAASRIREQ